MIRHFGVVCALALGIASSVTPLMAGDRALPMRFQLRQDAANNCTDNCRLLIAASGAITAETPFEFRKFAKGRDLHGATVVLDSDGGSVLGAIAGPIPQIVALAVPLLVVLIIVFAAVLLVAFEADGTEATSQP